MENTFVDSKRKDPDVAVAFLISIGVLMSLGGVLPIFDLFASQRFSFIQITFPWGILLTLCGFCMKRMQRRAWHFSMIVSAVGLPLFPLFTILSLVLLRVLWKARAGFFTNLQTRQAE